MTEEADLWALSEEAGFWVVAEETVLWAVVDGNGPRAVTEETVPVVNRRCYWRSLSSH